MSKALDLDAILARANAATPGPWTARYPPREGKGWATIVVPIPAQSDDDEDDYKHVTDLDDCVKRADADFIAAARIDVPDLVAAVRDLDAEIADLQEAARLHHERIDSILRILGKSPLETDIPVEIATLKTRLAMATVFEAHNGERVGVVMDRQNRRTGKWVALHAFDALKGDDGKVIQFEDADAAFAALDAYRARTTEKS